MKVLEKYKEGSVRWRGFLDWLTTGALLFKGHGWKPGKPPSLLSPRNKDRVQRWGDKNKKAKVQAS